MSKPSARNVHLLPHLEAYAPLVQPTPRWVRVKFAGGVIADSKRALLLRQYGRGRLPTYCFPIGDVRAGVLEPPATEVASLAEPGVELRTVRVGEVVAERVARVYVAPVGELAALAGHVTFDWDRMEAWFEEDEEVFVHARDPHKRVDVLRSTRHVRVAIGGVTVADTRRPHLLFETGLPTRYYLPPEDVRLDLLEPTTLTTGCPYKGVASYWSAPAAGRDGTNVAWSYPDPVPECPKVRGLIAFYDERVDVYVDGELQERPITPWSSRRS